MSAPVRRGALWLGFVVELLRFVAEVAIVVVLGWWGWATPADTWVSAVLVVALPLAVIVTWGLFGAPRRSMYPDSRWLPTVLILFLGGLAALALVDLGHPAAAIVLVVWVVVTDVLVQLGVHSPMRSTGSLRP